MPRVRSRVIVPVQDCVGVILCVCVCQNGHQVMIPYYESTEPEEVVQSFAKKYSLSESAVNKLRVRVRCSH